MVISSFLDISRLGMLLTFAKVVAKPLKIPVTELQIHVFGW
jgi:hypothetical protein